MSLNIVFGSIKSNSGRGSSVQEFDFPSIKIEAYRGSGTSRRVLFNKPACQLLGLEIGEVQNMLFGFAQPDGDGAPRLFVVNTEQFTHEVEQVTYKTSKNYAAYSGDSGERGKSISSSPLVKEIRDFMSCTDESQNVNYQLSQYSEGEAVVYELTPVSEDVDANEVVETVNTAEDQTFVEDMEENREFETANGIDEVSDEAPIEATSDLRDEVVGKEEDLWEEGHLEEA